jgi:hypothetical protein
MLLAVDVKRDGLTDLRHQKHPESREDAGTIAFQPQLYHLQYFCIVP